MTTLIAYLAAVAALAFGVGVVVTRQSVHTALSLLGNILSLAVLFLTYQAQFLAFVEVAVYAGAILVLFLFVITMLAAGKEGGRDLYGPALPGQIVSGIGVAALSAAAILLAFFRSGFTQASSHALFKGYGTVQQIGIGLFTHDILAFELTAPVLLAAVVGVVILAREKHERPEHRTGEPDESGKGVA